jgi:autotransporter-associated beta strand protein
MKRFGLLALLLVAPIASQAQLVLFTDNFTSSTTNKPSAPGGTPFNSFTSYDVAASKAAITNTTITSGDFKIALDVTTSSGLLEVQGVFSKSPITLVSPGDYINLTYTFSMTNPLPTTAAYLGQGLYNSAGSIPLSGGALNSGNLGGAGIFISGNCANWQGYFSRVFSTSNTVYTRPVQVAATTSAAQDLLGNGITGGFNNPGPALLADTATSTVTLTPGSVYTISYTIALTDTNTPTLAFTNTLYSGAGTGGAVLSTATTTATGTNYLTNSFDGLSLGRRETGSVPIRMDVTNITITANISTFPGQPFVVTGGGIACPGATFPVGLDGSVLNNDYYLFTNGVWTGVLQSGTGSPLTFPNETVISVPLTNTVIASNTVNANTGQMLGSVIVGPDSPPVITNQPIAVTVALNYPSVFTAGVTGGGLIFQWYKNGVALVDGGTISGSATSTLVISSTAPGDAATQPQGYYCIISNPCGSSATTVTNALTIGSPGNISWVGNVTSNWDLSTTANFNNGSAVVFHNGDNVTLPDGSAARLSIIGSFIAPTSINDNASQSYTIFGPGSIIGPGSVTKSTPGILAIVNSNAYSGGTTISGGGTLILTNQNFGAGTGTITLAGGTLEFPLKQANAAGCSNNINVTVSSTLQYDTNSTFGAVLNGAIMGNPGTTLTINGNNGATGTARMRLYGQFTNNSAIVLASIGEEVEIAPYLPSGDQIYNGIISGTVGRFTLRGNGNAIFTGANTFSDNTLVSTPNNASLQMSSGNVGIGADSVQTTPPTIDSSPVGTGLVAINSNPNSEGGTCSFFAYGGAHTIANQFFYTTATNTVTVVFSGTNDLTLTGEYDLAGANDTNGVQRTIQVTNTGATTLAGLVTDNSTINNNGPGTSTSGITKIGNGTLYLNGTNAYLGTTTNNGGVLAGTGWIAGPVFVETNGSIGGGGSSAIGTLSLSNNLTINGGVFVRVNKSVSPSNDVVSVNGTLANIGTGIVAVDNLGPALVAGDKFKIFNKAVTGGASLAVTGGGAGVVWNNNLNADGSISVASVGPGNPTTNAAITKVSLSGTNLIVHGTNNNVPNTSFHYVALTSTNIATPLSNWTSVVTNPFNPDGTFDYTNPIVPGTPRQFIDVKAVP